MKILTLILLLNALGAQATDTKITIQNSFYADARKQGLSHNTINTVIQTLGWQLNFNTLRKGDRFMIIGSEKKRPDAIFFKRKNHGLQAFLWGQKYYDKHGKTLQSGFLKAPLKYKRISSGFQYRRYHPILKTYLPHRAVDYAAKYGTPVYAVADGVVKKRKNIGILGNAVFIKHGSHYETVYAHLSRFSKRLRVGKPVRKGQLIGYVGSTGRSTGPHLHFEIRYKNQRKNPLRHKTPQQTSIGKAQLSTFKNRVNQMLINNNQLK